MERLWNRNYCKVMTANFSLFFAFYVLTPLLPLYLSEHFGATKDVIGLVLSGYTITALLFRPFSGYFVDSFPRKTVLMVCFGARFLIEFVKNDQVDFEANMLLNMGQLLSIPFILLGIGFLVYAFVKKQPAQAVHPK